MSWLPTIAAGLSAKLGRSAREVSPGKFVLDNPLEERKRVTELVRKGETQLPLQEALDAIVQDEQRLPHEPAAGVGPFSPVPFMIDWGKTNTALRNEFMQWLRQNRPLDISPQEKRGTSTTRDVLKALGAMRLLRGLTWKQAADYTGKFHADKQGEQKPLYVEPSEWNNARQRAEKTIAEFVRYYVTDGAKRNAARLARMESGMKILAVKKSV